MKELSIEEKAKAYDGLIERLKDLKFAYRFSPLSDTIEEKFPELKESEDERTWIINYLSNRELNSSIIAEKENLKKAIAWLQRQGEQKQEWSEEDDYNLQCCIAKVQNDIDNGRIGRNRELLTWLESLKDRVQQKQGEQKLVDKIQLGKKYKCIASPRYSTFRIGEIYKPEDKFLCSLMNFCSDCFEPIEDEQKPAYTKEYDFHGIKFIPKFAKGDIIKDKKCGEVSTIEDFSYDTGLYTHTYGQFPITIQDNYEIIAQKPAWSKEDEKIIRRIDSLLYSQCKIHGSEYEEIHNWLKSLRPQNNWKPSESDILLLERIANGESNPQDFQASLGGLIGQLKKLREE